MRAAIAVAAFLVCGSAVAAETGAPAEAAKDAPPDYKEKGKASFYGKHFQGKRTATGERFDKDKKTAAHPTLPLGSKVEVTNLETGKSTEVKINDRGPAKPGRAIDLSERAAKAIGLTREDGVAPVKIEAPDSKKGAQKQGRRGDAKRKKPPGKVGGAGGG